MRRHWLAVVGVVSILAAGGAALFFGLGNRTGTDGGVNAAQVPAEPALPPFFEDVTAASGVRHTYRNGEDTADHLSILESLGGGLAVIDYDGDGRLDLFLTGGGHFAGPDKKEIVGDPCRLYRNLGDFKFEDVTAAAGLDALAGKAPWFYTHAAAVADYDRDGWPDLLVTGWGRVALFHNERAPDGGRLFKDVSAAAGLDKGITWATSAAWADLDADGYPDLYVCQYVDWSFSNHPTDCKYDGKTPDVCPPKRFKGLRHKVYKNDRGVFADITEPAGLHPGGDWASKGLGVVAVDVNGDGKPDIYVANDTVPNFLYVNQTLGGPIKLLERGLVSGTALDGGAAANGSMGVDAGDPEGTGKPALWVTNYENELHALYRNLTPSPDRPSFVFATQPSGIAAIGQKFVGWGTGFLDFDHDGWEDIFISDGHAIRFPTGTTRRQKPVLLQNKNGKFTDVTKRAGTYFAEVHLGRGAVWADLDNDGRFDLVCCHTNEPVSVLKNVADVAGRHWLGVTLAGKDHADVVGARVVAETADGKMTRFAKGGGSYASSPDRRHLFGLGAADRVAKLTVYWPDGTTQEWADVPADRYVVIAQGQKELQAPAKPKG